MALLMRFGWMHVYIHEHIGMHFHVKFHEAAVMRTSDKPLGADAAGQGFSKTSNLCHAH